MNKIIRPGHFGCKRIARKLSEKTAARSDSLAPPTGGAGVSGRFRGRTVAVPRAECDFLFIGNDIIRSAAVHTARHRIANCL